MTFTMLGWECLFCDEKYKSPEMKYTKTGTFEFAIVQFKITLI